MFLNIFRKHVTVHDNTEFRCNLSSDLDGLGNYEELAAIFRVLCLLKSQNVFLQIKSAFPKHDNYLYNTLVYNTQISVMLYDSHKYLVFSLHNLHCHLKGQGIAS